ncbi:F-box only protein 4-like isoform X1 [Lytechinus variegatus]|uniref:F-box only protein 4-like isoform X1 n=2 Tax=Lytechinus variegatus TaxID=7654 RepID=UPI001BB1C9A7|nr:F-box only protein 4-like isoform X1 [Lytechinus variegatus]
MFGDQNNVREVEEALARHACQPAGFGLGSFLDLDQLAQQVQTLKMNLDVSVLPQQCKSFFTMEPSSPGVELDDGGMSSIEMDDSRAHSQEGGCCYGDDDEVGLLNIPVQAFLHILQYLDAKDICSLSSTCRQCNSFCSDQHLWKSVLNKDMVKWSEVSHGTYPTNLTASQDVDYKDVYMRCHPELQRDPAFNLASIPRLLWSFLPHRTPIIVMFGPGLETDTSTIVRKFITGHGSNIIKVNGVFPAMYPGSVGTGFEVTVNDKSRMRLVVLYSATRKEREARDSNQPRMSKLIKRTSPPNQGEEEGASRNDGEDHGNGAPASRVTADDEDYLNFEPNDHVKSMCRVVGGFIFVVDAAQQLNQGSCSSGRPELFAFMDSRWTPERKPLLVLSSIANPDVPRIPCVRVADQLSLDRLQRPWKVVDCDVSTLSGLSEGVDWLVGSAQKM